MTPNTTHKIDNKINRPERLGELDLLFLPEILLPDVVLATLSLQTGRKTFSSSTCNFLTGSITSSCARDFITLSLFVMSSLDGSSIGGLESQSLSFTSDSSSVSVLLLCIYLNRISVCLNEYPFFEDAFTGEFTLYFPVPRLQSQRCIESKMKL